MSDYFRRNVAITSDFVIGKSWAILSPTESRLKKKIEAIGTPLKDWDVRINRGILTGLNEAFIIDAQTKEDLIAKSAKNEEIIRPILFGENIKRFYTNWKDSYLINSHNGIKNRNLNAINLEANYPDLFSWLLPYKEKLQKRNDKGNHWSNLRNCAYLDDFSKPKIIYPEITKFLNFYYDVRGLYLTNNKCFILTGEKIEFLICFLNSKLFRYAFMNNFPKLVGDAYEMRKVFFERIPVLKVTDLQNEEFCKLLSKYSSVKLPMNKLLENEANDLIYNLYQIEDNERIIIDDSYAATL